MQNMILLNTFSKFKAILPFTQKLRLLSVKTNRDVVFEKLSSENSGIAVIGFNRPKPRNALSINLVTEFEESLSAVHQDTSIRVCIIRSLVPGIFCAGADLKERLTLTPSDVSKFVTRLRSLMTSLSNLPVPAIAALDGTALGGGLELALACDIRTASTSAKLGLVETKLAIIPGAGGTQRLPRIINVSLAKELIYTARVLDGNEAEKIGLVNHAIKQNKDGDAAYLKALEIAREIVPNGPFAVKMAKQAINRGIDTDLQSALQQEEECYAKIIPTQDRIEGLKAFSEKRPPKYTGQ